MTDRYLFRTKDRSRGRVAALLGVFCVAAVLCLAMPARAEAASISDVPDATVQTDGRVAAVLVSGDRIYIGGYFTHVNGVPRSRLAAIDANTGQLTNWAPRANSRVRALAASADGSKIYAGGRFTTINGVTRNRLAAFDATTGQLDDAWRPNANSEVYSLAVSGNQVYVGGVFKSVNGQRRLKAARVDATTGRLDSLWNPSMVQDAATETGWVHALVPSPAEGRVYAAGRFRTVSGQPRTNLVALDPVTGAPDAWRPNPCYPIDDIVVSGRSVYVAGGGFPSECGAGGWGEAFDTVTGASLWRHSGDGDFQAVALLGGTVYFGGHFLEIPWNSGLRNAINFVAIDAATGVRDTQWTPVSRGGSPWAMAADPLRNRLYVGGDFTTINGQPQQGFTQFSG
jgi:trimeric autotransporter adhesin